jgi:hypothetical protein
MRCFTPEQRRVRERPIAIWTRFALSVACAYVICLEVPAQGQQPQASPGKPPPTIQGQQPEILPGKTPQLTLFPGRERAFRLESEAEIRVRMAREAREGSNPTGMAYTDVFFPQYPPPPKGPLPVRQWEPLAEVVPPPWVCYRRLYFEQLNTERYGWDLGVLSPLASVGAFYVDLFALPYHAATEPLRRYECNTGYCLPGDPVPLLLYPPELSLTGALGEAAAIGLGVVIFP